MKIGCVCPTYNRPRLVGRAIHCFEQQTYQHCELIVVDDAQQLAPAHGANWILVSVPERFSSLGAKRQYGMRLLSRDCDGYMCWDDDDVYFPHAVESVAAALTDAAWAQPRLAYHQDDGELVVVRTFGVNSMDWGYGGAWAYRLDAIRAIGGYDGLPGADDAPLARKFFAAFGTSADSSPDTATPWYLYNSSGHDHVSQEGIDFWEKRASYPRAENTELRIGWNGQDVYSLPVRAGIFDRPW